MPPLPSKERISKRIAEVKDVGLAKCSTPFCGRPTMAAAGKGLALYSCAKCVQARARHGSTFGGTIKATSLRPYVRAAQRWVEANKANSGVAYALLGLRGVLDGAGAVEPALAIRDYDAPTKSRIAFARLREAGVKPETLLSLQIGVMAYLADDGYAPQTEEYKLVQTAKAAFRRASGTHRDWGSTYPRSSGGVLRSMGREIAETCGSVAEVAVPAVLADKLAKHGPHESQLPGYVPPWQTKANPPDADRGQPAPVETPAAAKPAVRRGLKDWLRLPDA